MTSDQGPYITALLCEKVLEEKDGIKTAVRVLDRITHVRVGPDAPPGLPPFDYQLAMLIKLVSGSTRGLYTVVVQLVAPTGESKEVLRQAVNFEGEDDRGGDMVARMSLRIEMTGVYWFEILLEDQGRLDLLTRLPMRVVYLPQSSAKPGGPRRA